MPHRNEQFKRFINQTLAEATADPGQPTQPRAPTINMLVGSVAGDVFIMGDVSHQALEKILSGRRRAPASDST